jgi:hypothetical protein
MPGEISSAIVPASKTLVHSKRVIQRVRATGRVVGRMNSDERRAHRSMQGTSAIPRRDNALRDVQFPCAGGRRAADGGGSRSHCTGRKEKPRQDDGKKPGRIKFHRNHICCCKRKLIKNTARRASCRNIRDSKRNRFGFQAYEERQTGRNPSLAG